MLEIFSDRADESNKECIKILRKRMHEETLLEKLLENEIIKEFNEILQYLLMFAAIINLVLEQVKIKASENFTSHFQNFILLMDTKYGK